MRWVHSFLGVLVSSRFILWFLWPSLARRTSGQTLFLEYKSRFTQNYPTYFSNCYNLWCHCQLPKIWVATRLDSSTAPFHNPRAPGPIIRSALCINSWEISKLLFQFEQRILEARMLKSIWRHVTSQPLRSENLLSHQSQNVPCIHIVIVEKLAGPDLTWPDLTWQLMNT